MARLNISPEEVNQLFPIAGVRFYSHAIVLLRSFNGECAWELRRGTRKKITRVSQRSLNNLAFLVTCCEVKFASLLTLTYGANYPSSGRQVKADLNKFLIYLKRSMGKFEYVWFLEFQRRGAPHFHLLLTLPGPGRCERELVAEIWSKIAEPIDMAYTGISSPYGRKNATMGISTRDSVFKQHRRQRTWEAIRSEDGAARYALKYALKAKQKEVPSAYRDVGRFWSPSRGVRVPDVNFYPATEREVREAVSLLGRDMRGFEVLPKLIFHNGKLP